jgi:hypothetical protein
MDGKRPGHGISTLDVTFLLQLPLRGTNEVRLFCGIIVLSGETEP